MIYEYLCIFTCLIVDIGMLPLHMEYAYKVHVNKDFGVKF